MEKVLVLAPHTDDAELGCGGSIARLIEEGAEVHVAVFSTCRKSVPQGFPENVLEQEFRDSMQVFGIPESHQYIFDYEVRDFPRQRQSILEDMIGLRKSIRPTLVLTPSVHDIHQDHNTIGFEALRAYKLGKLLGYEIGWNNYTFNNQFFVKLEQRHLECKLAAIQCYKSQGFRSYAGADVLNALMKARGAQICERYAEVFEVNHWIV